MSSGNPPPFRFVEPRPVDPQFGKFTVTGTPSRSSAQLIVESHLSPEGSTSVVRLDHFNNPPRTEEDPSLAHIRTFQLDGYTTSPEPVTRRAIPKTLRSHLSSSPASPLSRTVSQNALTSSFDAYASREYCRSGGFKGAAEDAVVYARWLKDHEDDGNASKPFLLSPVHDKVMRRSTAIDSAPDHWSLSHHFDMKKM